MFYPPLVEGRSRDWIWERVGREDETLKGIVMLHGNGAPTQWAEIEGPEASADYLVQFVSKKGWQGNLTRKEEPSEEIQVYLGEQGEVPVSFHADRLIRMMPVMKALIEEVSK